MNEEQPTLEQVQAWIASLPLKERQWRAMQQALVELGHILRPDDYPCGPIPFEPAPDVWSRAWQPYVTEAKEVLL